MSRTPRRPASVVVLGLGAAALLSGCAGLDAGAASVLGSQQVGTDVVAEQVAAVHRANGEPVDQVDEALTRGTVERLTMENLVRQGAERLGVTVTQGAVDASLAGLDAQLGGRENLEKAFLESGVPPESIENTVTLQLQAEEMAKALVPNGALEEQQRAVYDYVVQLSEELDVTISPRFGTWDAQQLAVGPRPTDIAVPAIDLVPDGPVGPLPEGTEQPDPAASPSAS